MTDPLAQRVARLRGTLARPPAPELVDFAAERVIPLRARLDVVYGDALARDARALERYRRTGGIPQGPEKKSGWRKGGQPRCESCKLFIESPAATCGSCGYTPGRGFRETGY